MQEKLVYIIMYQFFEKVSTMGSEGGAPYYSLPFGVNSNDLPHPLYCKGLSWGWDTLSHTSMPYNTLPYNSHKNCCPPPPRLVLQLLYTFTTIYNCKCTITPTRGFLIVPNHLKTAVNLLQTPPPPLLNACIRQNALTKHIRLSGNNVGAMLL